MEDILQYLKRKGSTSPAGALLSGQLALAILAEKGEGGRVIQHRSGCVRFITRFILGFGLLHIVESLHLTAFIHGSTGPVVHSFASRYEGPRFNPQGVLM